MRMPSQNKKENKSGKKKEKRLKKQTNKNCTHVREARRRVINKEAKEEGLGSILEVPRLLQTRLGSVRHLQTRIVDDPVSKLVRM